MRIAQIAPLIESVPPRFYGGTERIVSYLTEELVRRNHEVVLFASGDSTTSAELVAGCPKALRLDVEMFDPLPHHVLMLERVRQQANRFDILHFHIDYLHFPLMRGRAGTTVTTLHGRLDQPDLVPLFAEFDDMPLVSVSDYQRQSLKGNWVGAVHHGLPPSLYEFTPGSDDGYLAFLGRMSPEKRPDRAIEIARRAGMDLKIAAKIDGHDRPYFDQVVRPLLSEPHVEFLGEIGEAQKRTLLGGAKALLFPIDWPEPFGLVMIEALACGTPVIAWRCASTPEVVEPGVTGYLVDSIEEAVAAVGRVDTLDRRLVRRRFEERFTAEKMTREYVAIYRSLLARAARSSAAA